MRIHDPDVVYTDLALAVLGAYLAWRLIRRAPESAFARRGVWLMGALASAAFWGAVFHAFFPENTATRAGYLAWVPVVLSIVVVSATLAALAVHLLMPAMSSGMRRVVVLVYALAFVAVTLLIDESYGTIVRFYAPALILFLVAAARRASAGLERGWWLLAAAIVVSMVAAVVQQARVVLHPVYFDHNALYHVVQGIALVMIYVGFLRVAASAPATR
jgi:hypothetical protein